MTMDCVVELDSCPRSQREVRELVWKAPPRNVFG
jgi:hypothetical protein